MRPWPRILTLCAFPLLGILLYANTFRNPAIWDDHTFVFGQPFLRDGANLRQVLDPRYLYRILPVRNSARPVWLASLLLDAALAHGSLLVYRLSSLFWYLFDCFLVLMLTRKLGRDDTAAAMAGILFLTHPVHTEAVNILTFRTELLSFGFAALSAYLYLAARERAGNFRRAAILGSLLSFALALLAKEMAATLPCLLVLADALFPAEREDSAARRRRRRLYAAYGLVLILYLLFRIPRSGYVMEGRSDAFSAWRDSAAPGRALPWAKPIPDASFVPPPEPSIPTDPPPWSGPYFASARVRALTMLKIFGSYLRVLAWPHPLQGDYAPEPAFSLLNARVLTSIAAWIAILAAAWTARRSRPLLAFGLFAMPILLMPVSGVIALKNLQAERYLFSASAGWCVAVAAVLAEWTRDRRAWARLAGYGLFLVLSVVCAVLTVVRNRDYRSDFAFYRATESVDDRVPRVHFNLALDYAYRNLPDEAEKEFREALGLWPESLKGRMKFVEFLIAQNRVPEAVAEIQKDVERHPDEPVLRYRLAMLLWRIGDKDRAAPFLKSVADLGPEYWRAQLLAGETALGAGRATEAVARLESVMRSTRGQSLLARDELARARRLVGAAP
jgi:tetratricopeptide (TPR) repeat protein